MKKTVTILLVICLLITAFPGTALAKAKYVSKESNKKWEKIYPNSYSDYKTKSSDYELRIYQWKDKKYTQICFEIYRNGKYKKHYTTSKTKLSSKGDPIAANLNKDKSLAGIATAIENLEANETRLGILYELQGLSKEKSEKRRLEGLSKIINNRLKACGISHKVNLKTKANPIETAMKHVDEAASVALKNYNFKEWRELKNMDTALACYGIVADMIKNSDTLMAEMLKNPVVSGATKVAMEVLDHVPQAIVEMNFAIIIAGEMGANSIDFLDLITEPLQTAWSKSAPGTKIYPYYNYIDADYNTIVSRILKIA